MILTAELVHKAIRLVEPAILAILDDPGMYWGPQYVWVAIIVPGEDRPSFWQFGNEPSEWLPEWGAKKDSAAFNYTASRKVRLAHRHGERTSIIVAVKPWLLKPGDFLYAGGVSEDGISVGTSGIKSSADELVSELILAALKTLARLNVQARIANGDAVL